MLGFAAASMTIRDQVGRSYEFTISGRKVSHPSYLTERHRKSLNADVQVYSVPLTGLPMAFAFDVCAAIVSAVAVCLTWVRWGLAVRILDKRYIPMHPVDFTISYYPTSHHTLESWNCVLARNVVPRAQDPTRPPLMSLCREGKTARYLTLVLLVLALLRVTLKPLGCFFAWRRQNIRARWGEHEAAHFKTDDPERQGGGSSEWSTTAPQELHSSSLVELPGDWTSKAELDDSGMVRELWGAMSSKELEGSVAALETDGSEVSKSK